MRKILTLVVLAICTIAITMAVPATARASPELSSEIWHSLKSGLTATVHTSSASQVNATSPSVINGIHVQKEDMTADRRRELWLTLYRS